MSTTSVKTAQQPKQLNYLRGALFAIPGILVGLVAWIVIWEMGFIASLATFAMAWLVVFLYRKGAGGVDMKSLYVVIGYIVLGIVLSILAGMVADGMHFAMDEMAEFKHAGVLETLTRADFWDLMISNLTSNGELWSGYATTILMSVGLGALGVFGTIKDVLSEGKGGDAPADKPAA